MNDFNELEARIKLAEARGWVNIHERNMVPEKKGWYGYLPHMSFATKLPNPFKDANDCDQVRNHLIQLGWIVAVICHPDKAVIVSIQHRDGRRHTVEVIDWKHGVCELALKVISDE